MALSSTPISSYAALPTTGSGNVSTSSAGGSSAMGPLALAVPAIGSFLASLFGMSSQNKNAEKERQLQAQQLAQQKALAEQNTALDESQLDPWRHSMFQAGDLAKLDKLERGTYTPANVSMPARYAAYKPTLSGGYQYQKSPELVQSAAALKKGVMSGQGAPTMTNKANYGQTGAMDILSVLAGADPLTARAKTGATTTGQPSAYELKKLFEEMRAGQQG